MSLSFGLLSYPALHTQPFAVKGQCVMLHLPCVGATGKLNTKGLFTRWISSWNAGRFWCGIHALSTQKNLHKICAYSAQKHAKLIDMSLVSARFPCRFHALFSVEKSTM